MLAAAIGGVDATQRKASIRAGDGAELAHPPVQAASAGWERPATRSSTRAAAHVLATYSAHYAVTLYLADVSVLRPEKF